MPDYKIVPQIKAKGWPVSYKGWKEAHKGAQEHERKR